MFSVLDDYSWMKRGFLPHGAATSEHDWQWREAINAVDAEVNDLWDEEHEQATEDSDGAKRGDKGAHTIHDGIHGVPGRDGERHMPGGIVGRKTGRRPRHAPK